MVTDGQVRKLRHFLDQGIPLAHAARRTGMSDKTARRYRDDAPLPSARPKSPRTYRTRPDPFAAVWAEVEERLRAEPRLTAKTLFVGLRGQHPGRFFDSHRRTFEWRVRRWRARVGPAKLAVFRQVHTAGDLAASDFTCMNGLGVTIARRPFDHLVYHFVLTYSNWESVTVCASESFEALADGLQNTRWELGGVPRKHRSDSLSAAVNNLSAAREFRTRYRDLLDHYRLAGQRINVRQAHKNGDAESSHGHFKTVVDQALLLRGSRDFATRDEFAVFLRDRVAVRNDGRRDRFAEEVGALKPLPDTRLAGWSVKRCRVDSGSLIHVRRCTYPVPSRLIGEWVDARLHADRVEVWFAAALVDTLPRLVGRDRHAVHYRHGIDSLVRKPGAFARYAYRDDLFPTSRFRLAYDRFGERHDERRQAKEYLALVHRAATHGEAAVDDARRVLLAGDTPLTAAAVIALAEKASALAAATEVVVEPPDLTAVDSLVHV
ncbi:MAG: IS21 family transposase, partial [Acidimicrobiales bacterium]|nr:IS21 family transposase [Acidimicrobiales bacterium]